MKSIAVLEPDQEFGGDVLGLEQVFASVGLSVDPSPMKAIEEKCYALSAPSHASGSNWQQGQRMGFRMPVERRFADCQDSI